jgi:hypothetical protein
MMLFAGFWLDQSRQNGADLTDSQGIWRRAGDPTEIREEQ